MDILKLSQRDVGIKLTSDWMRVQAVDNAGKLRASLDGLADRGNPNAALLVTELKKRGITINPQAGAAAAGAAAASMSR